jgi:hypothetical protein
LDDWITLSQNTKNRALWDWILGPVLTILQRMEAHMVTRLDFDTALTNIGTSLTALAAQLTSDVASLQAAISTGNVDMSAEMNQLSADAVVISSMAAALKTTEVPNITSPLTASGVVGQAFSYQITATHPPLSFGATGLPTNISVTASSGLITGIPQSAGVTNVTLSAVNAAGTANAVLVITVTAS